MFEQQVVLDDTRIKYVRNSLVWEKVGVSVGLIQALYFVMMVVIRPVARHSFLIRGLKRLYYARTSDGSIFKEQSKNPLSKTKYSITERQNDLAGFEGGMDSFSEAVNSNSKT